MSFRNDSHCVRTVTLELLRHGPPHNQLLSPLTEYLGLCGNHSSVTVRVPYEHNEFRVHQETLLQDDDDDASGKARSQRTRDVQLKLLAHEMGEILGSIPGLIAEMKDGADDKEGMTRLELVSSASELALLPFELANSPIGFPGAGQFLCLQAERPVCVTRRIRRVDAESVCWPERKPKILFAASDRGGSIPFRAHLAALLKALSPWLSDRKSVDAWLKVLPQASIQEISHEISTGAYTYVHVLAHGVAIKEGFDTRYALRLHQHSDRRQAHDVHDKALVSAFRPHDESGTCCHVHQPTVVTIASCNSGNIGSVVGAGASVAHVLHESGIPLVVSSQFPLTFGASTVLGKRMVEGYLWGVNPYVRLSQLRKELSSLASSWHDWASIIAYASLPPDLEDQLQEYRVQQAHRVVEVAFDLFDDNMRRWGWYRKTESEIVSIDESEWRKAVQRLEVGKKRLMHVLEGGTEQNSRLHGLLASVEKRQAEMEYWRIVKGRRKERDRLPSQVRDSLEESRSSYWMAYEEDRSSTWALTQYISLCAVLESRINLDDWMTATHMSLQDISGSIKASTTVKTRWKQEAWGLGNLIELYLLSYFTQQPRPDLAEEHARRLQEVVPRQSWEMFSTCRQIARYRHWYSHFRDFPDGMIDFVTDLTDRILPTEVLFEESESRRE